MKLNTITLSLLLAFSGLTQAQNKPAPINYQISKATHCQNKPSLLNDDQARDLGVSLVTNNLLLVQHYISNYCLDGKSYSRNEEFNPLYLARSNDAIKYLLSAGIQPFNKLHNEAKIDILSFFLLEHEVNKQFTQVSSQFINTQLKQIEETLKLSNLSRKIPDISEEERKKMLSTLLSEYKRNDFLHRDSLNNYPSTYALIASEPEILGKSLTLSPNLALFQKNKDGLSLFHIAMLPKYTVGNEETKTNKLQAINNFLISNLTEKNIIMARYEDLTYIDFVSLMKDNNPELYKSVISKFSTVTPTRFNSMTNDEKIKAKLFFNNFDYVERMKKLLEK